MSKFDAEAYRAERRARRLNRKPHHGRGGSQHVGRIRTRLAEIISDCLGIVCYPEELRPAGGRQRNNTTEGDGYAWEVFAANEGRTFVAGSFDTMTNCVKAGRVTLADGEISADFKNPKTLVEIFKAKP